MGHKVQMTQNKHALAEVKMTAARTKQHQKEKHIVTTRTEKNAKKKKQENRTQSVDSNKASRLCYKAEPGTLPHELPSSSYARRQRCIHVYPLQQ